MVAVFEENKMNKVAKH